MGQVMRAEMVQRSTVPNGSGVHRIALEIGSDKGTYPLLDLATMGVCYRVGVCILPGNAMVWLTLPYQTELASSDDIYKSPHMCAHNNKEGNPYTSWMAPVEPVYRGWQRLLADDNKQRYPLRSGLHLYVPKGSSQRTVRIIWDVGLAGLDIK